MKEEIQKIVKGEILDDQETLSTYSHDASLFEVRPQLVVYPKDAEDIKSLVKFVSQEKTNNPPISITVRSAGSDMSGGPLNESIVIDVTKHISGIKGFGESEVAVLPGTFYRDFEAETLKRGFILPCYTASKNLCAIGGMIGNNAGGEKTLSYGKMENYIESLKAVFSDGHEYEIKSLTKDELDRKMSQNDFEGNIYKNIWGLIQKNREEIEKAKPQVSKNSAGYYIWNVWDGKTFDLCKLIVGSQGTLGIVTEAKLKLVPVKKKSKLFVVFLRNLDHLSELVNEILPLKPESLESYDDATLKLAVRFFPEMMKSMKIHHFFKLMFSFLPEAKMILTGGIPRLILLVEFSGDSDEEIDAKMNELKKKIKHFHYASRFAQSMEESEKYWTIRRESFNLLRKHVRGKRTAPFVDDVIVKPEYLPGFLPKMRKILDEYKLVYTIAGHAGNGNFHVIPLMDMSKEISKEIILEVSEKVYDLVSQYKGSLTAEHNDGIVRTPYLGKMFNSKMLEIFTEIKAIFDPQNILNPNKKVGGSLEYLKNHIATK